MFSGTAIRELHATIYEKINVKKISCLMGRLSNAIQEAVRIVWETLILKASQWPSPICLSAG